MPFLRRGEFGRIFHDATVRQSRQLAESLHLLLVGPEDLQTLCGGLAGVEPSPARPVGELAGGHGDLLGGPRPAPFTER